jgi:hypothetical protein
MRKLLSTSYSASDMSFHFWKWNYTECKKAGFDNKLEHQKVIREIIREYFLLLAEASTTQGYIIKMGYGLGIIYLGNNPVQSSGIYPKNLNGYKNLLDFPNTPEFQQRKKKNFYDQTGYRLFKLKWKKGRLKNVKVFSVKSLKNYNIRIYNCVQNNTLKHY